MILRWFGVLPGILSLGMAATGCGADEAADGPEGILTELAQLDSGPVTEQESPIAPPMPQAGSPSPLPAVDPEPISIAAPVAEEEPAPRPLNDPRPAEFRTVTATFGQLYVREGSFEATADVRPWSSYSYPYKDSIFFKREDGRLSTLAKYDLFAEKVLNLKTVALARESEDPNLYNPEAVDWEGRCHAWAVASILHPEPKGPREIGGIRFETQDLKALLIKSYENYRATGGTESVPGSVREFGQRFEGEWNHVQADLYPDQFHKILEVELLMNRRPFIIDKNANHVVWNIPIFDASVDIGQDPVNANVLHVKARIIGANPFVGPDTENAAPVNYDLTYDLWGNPQPDGTWEIVFGEWTGRSRNFHPDFATLVPAEGVEHGSVNPEVTSAVLDELFARILQ